MTFTQVDEVNLTVATVTGELPPPDGDGPVPPIDISSIMNLMITMMIVVMMMGMMTTTMEGAV